jgi:hypothetical protein
MGDFTEMFATEGEVAIDKPLVVRECTGFVLASLNPLFKVGEIFRKSFIEANGFWTPPAKRVFGKDALCFGASFSKRYDWKTTDRKALAIFTVDERERLRPALRHAHAETL